MSISKKFIEMRENNDYELNYLISESIHKLVSIKYNNENHILTVDDHLIKDSLDLENLIDNIYRNKDFNAIFDENTKIHLKLKINLNEYLALNSLIYPTFIKWD
jgi:hypothetical protein